MLTVHDGMLLAALPSDPVDRMPDLKVPPRRFAFADFILSPQDGTLVHRGHKVRLQDQQLRLLALLVERAGEVVTREEIQANLWPENTYVEFDKSLRVAVNKVREALHDSADRPSYVETVPRRGYRFIAPVTVTVIDAPTLVEPATAQTLSRAHAPFAPNASRPSAGAVPGTGTGGRWILIAVSAALAIAIAITVFHRAKPAQPTQDVSAHPVLRRSVAVVGLQNLTGNPSDRWLSTALGEMLSSELAATDSLRVIPGEEIARAGLADAPVTTPSHDTLARYAHQLGADMIVYGSFAVTHSPHPPKSGDPLRLDLRVENLSSDAPSLVLVKVGQTSGLFGLVTESGADIRQRLGLESLSQEASNEVRNSLPLDATAAQFYAEGLNRLHLFDALGARELLTKAAKIEPDHAGTHQALSDAWSALGYDAESRTEAERAVQLSGKLPRQQALAMQGKLALRTSDGTHATELFRTLFTFYPDNVDYGLNLAEAQDLAGHTPDALATLKTLNWPGIPDVDKARIELLRARFNLFLGDFSGALASSEKVDQIGQSLGLSLIRAQGLQQEASALERQSKATESLAASALAQGFYKSAGDERGEATALLMSGDVQYDTGKLPQAQATFESALSLFRAVGHKRGAGNALERIGNVRYDQGALAESRRYYSMALDIYRELHLDGSIASAVGNIANVQDSEGDIAGALSSNELGLAIFEKTGNQRGVAVTLSNMGNLEMERGALDQAQQDYKRSEEINRKTGYKRGEASALAGQGDVLVAQDDLTSAVHLIRQGMKLLEGTEEPEAQTSLHSSLGVAEFLQGQPQTAIHDLQLAVDLAIQRGDHGNASQSLSWLALAEAAEGDRDKAIATAHRAITEGQNQLSPQIQLIAALAFARIQGNSESAASSTKSLQSAEEAARRYGYAPLALEARILLARIQPKSNKRRQQLNALAQEAVSRGWKQLAADARATDK